MHAAQKRRVVLQGATENRSLITFAGSQVVDALDTRTSGTQLATKSRMNATEMKGNLNIAKGKLKQRWAKLTDDDLGYVEGKEDELVGRIQKRTGETVENVKKAVDEACSCCSHD